MGVKARVAVPVAYSVTRESTTMYIGVLFAVGSIGAGASKHSRPSRMRIGGALIRIPYQASSLLVVIDMGHGAGPSRHFIRKPMYYLTTS